MGKEFDILIVDDDSDIRESLRIILEKNGYKTRNAKNGKESDLSTCHTCTAPQRGAHLPRTSLIPARGAERCRGVFPSVVVGDPYEGACCVLRVACSVYEYGRSRMASRTRHVVGLTRGYVVDLG